MSIDNMSNDITMPLSNDQIEATKSVTKVQKLANVSFWNDNTAIIRDYIQSFFTKKNFLRLKHDMNIRKRVIVITPDDHLFVYETNCTGYAFDIKSAIKLKTSSTRIIDKDEKTCTITLKYKFGSVNLILINNQISVWRRTLSSIFEQEYFDRSLVSDITLYTATGEVFDDGDTTFEYTDEVYSLKSVEACMNLSPDENNMNYGLSALDVTQEAFVDTSKTNSNRSLTYMPGSMKSTRSISGMSMKMKADSEVKQNMNNGNYSVRRGAKCVSYLAKKFEGKLKETIGKKKENEKEIFKKPCSPPLEILFPPLPIKKLAPEEVKNSESDKSIVVSKYEYTPIKRQWTNTL